MPIYQFNDLYYRVAGEYENVIQILFINPETADLLVYDTGTFYLVNKPPHLNLEGFSRHDISRSCSILLMVEKHANSEFETYIHIEGALIKIGWQFDAGAGQKVETIWIIEQKKSPKQYELLLDATKSMKPAELTDLRFGALPQK